jgi:hypothetical protein
MMPLYVPERLLTPLEIPNPTAACPCCRETLFVNETAWCTCHECKAKVCQSCTIVLWDGRVACGFCASLYETCTTCGKLTPAIELESEEDAEGAIHYYCPRCDEAAKARKAEREAAEADAESARFQKQQGAIYNFFFGANYQKLFEERYPTLDALYAEAYGPKLPIRKEVR